MFLKKLNFFKHDQLYESQVVTCINIFIFVFNWSGLE